LQEIEIGNPTVILLPTKKDSNIASAKPKKKNKKGYK
jgi:hypothetical protein